MNKKQFLLVTIICISVIVITARIGWGVRIYQRENDPYWQAAKEIYEVQTTLQESDKKWQLESLSDVRHCVIKGANGVSINYYCCITSYLNVEPSEIEGLNKTALDLVVDIDTFENRNDCKVGSWDGVQGKLEDMTYICWTVSPEYSCVLEYIEGTISEEDIFRMAESVQYKPL